MDIVGEGRLRRVMKVVNHDRCRNLATRDVLMRQYLNADEREIYASRNEDAQREWLLTRVAVKDAARQWLWSHGTGELFPIELDVIAAPDGAWRVFVPGDHRSLDIDVVQLDGGVLAHVRD